MPVLTLIVAAGAASLILWEIRKMSTALDNLTAKVEAQTTVIDGAVTLLGTLAQEIRDNTGDEDALNALADKIDAQTQELATAVTTNTPAAPAPTEPSEPTGGEAGQTPDNPDAQPTS